jgi:FlaA1/EpsC-like NDP-sugar epimerase
MVESYDPHSAGFWRKTLRGIAVAPLVGLLVYSLLFTINLDPNSLPRIAVGRSLSRFFLTLGWRAIYIRLYTSSGLMRRVLIVGAGKAGHSLADIYRKLNPPPFILLGFIDDDLREERINPIMDLPFLGQVNTSLILLRIIVFQISWLPSTARSKAKPSKLFWIHRNVAWK